MKVLLFCLKQSLKSVPYVFKKIHLYFGFYFIPFTVFIFHALFAFFPYEQNFFSHIATVISCLVGIVLTFMVPYYTYKHSKSSHVKPFWIFIRQTFWPVIWNLYIKSTVIVLSFSILLIIPGLYKATRLSFVNETIFFDDSYKQGQISALKGSDKTSRDYFWSVFLVLVFYIIFSITPDLVDMSFSPVSASLRVISLFYIDIFLILFYTQFYFELKKQKGENLSL